MLEINGIRECIVPIAKEYGLRRIYLFGSYAKGNANDDSDIDLLIEKGKPLSLLKLAGFRQKVEEVTQLPVDVITTTGIAEDFKETISGTEVLLYEE